MAGGGSCRHTAVSRPRRPSSGGSDIAHVADATDHTRLDPTDGADRGAEMGRPARREEARRPGFFFSLIMFSSRPWCGSGRVIFRAELGDMDLPRSELCTVEL